ncbi:phage portal protein [Paenibacillus hodogayensis]|uniref:Phage portal protein n=1 Tax=Paenibacillus hodogayensis TaxID=279208 RepID=A0ABV5VVP5_9BACL
MNITNREANNLVNGLPNVLFIMDAERAKQYRGVPYLAPAIEQVKQMGRYAEAEIAAAIINSFLTAFIKVEGPKNEISFGQSIPDEDQLRIRPMNGFPLKSWGQAPLTYLAKGKTLRSAIPSIRYPALILYQSDGAARRRSAGYAI